MRRKEPLREEARQLHETLCGDSASAIVEFAVSLPLLVVLVVGIFDFGGAFNLKQELNNAVREGARFAASQPTNDIGDNTPPSVDAVRYLVDSYLVAANINDCGLGGASMPGTSGNFTWSYGTSSGCSGQLSLTIQRQVEFAETVGDVNINLRCNTVTIQYPYQWHFNSVIQLLVPGSNFALTTIDTSATAVNMN